MTGRARFPAGVQPLDHTADIGMDVAGASLALLFDRAALGMMAFLAGHDLDEDEDAAPAGPGTVTAEAAEGTPEGGGSTAAAGAMRILELEAADPGLLLVGWLREILLECESEHVCYEGAVFETVNTTHLRARIRYRPGAVRPVREIKGVTYHDLAVRRSDEGWHARVVFDV